MSFTCTVYSKQQVTLACLSNVEKLKHTLIADSLLEDSFFKRLVKLPPYFRGFDFLLGSLIYLEHSSNLELCSVYRMTVIFPDIQSWSSRRHGQVQKSGG